MDGWRNAVNQPVSSEWPFSRSALMAGLRRYLATPRLNILSIEAVPLALLSAGSIPDPLSKLSGLRVCVEADGDAQVIDLVLKEAPVTEMGRVLTVVGRREYEVYRRLAPHLPVRIPDLVAGDPATGWIIVEALHDLRAPQDWTADDYVTAVKNLAAIHERFWGLGEDLAVFAWLGRPLDADYHETMLTSAESVQRLIQQEHLPALVTSRNFFAFGALVQAADVIAAPLRQEPVTLLHGDYWPGNIGQPGEGPQVIFDWQHANIGPAILDLLVFVQTTMMMIEAPPITAEALINLYRKEMARRVQPAWDDERFARLYDHAQLWMFLTHWLRRLARLTRHDYDLLPPRFERAWLTPVLETLERRLGVTLPE